MLRGDFRGNSLADFDKTDLRTAPAGSIHAYTSQSLSQCHIKHLSMSILSDYHMAPIFYIYSVNFE